jgi:membrane protein required for colicin V production
MTGFDIALVAVVALSALFAFVRGFIREVIALATWVVGFVLAIAYAGWLAGMFAWLDIAPAAKHVLAFAAILVIVLIVGALLSRTLGGVIRAVGLGFVDRMLGAAFGVARGLVVVVAFVLVAGVTVLPKQDWWQNSTLGRPLAEVALALKPYLPRAWADRLDYSAPGVFSAGLGELRLGEHRSCAES